MLPITYLATAKKYFKKLTEQPLRKAYLEAIQHIRNEPFSGDLKSGDLSGIYGYDVFYKGTNYEIAYRLEENEDGELIVVIMAGSRENFYEQLKRYLKN